MASNGSYIPGPCEPGYVPDAKGEAQISLREEYRGLVVLAILLLLLLVIFFIVDQRWQQRSALLKKAVEVSDQSREFAMNLAKSFMPSWKFEKYQFKGFQEKSIGVDIKFEDVSLELHDGTQILENVTGEFGKGRMCAIMGPSGAGKTSFMNALCGKATYGKMGGTVLINGQKMEVSQIKSIMGFVPQDDIVHEELTVREQIRFSAELRNEAGTSSRRIQKIVNDVLHVMQIEHIMNKIVGGVENRGISGGQRKRVNIGLELAAQPTLLFLDEPTSGLDATSSLTVVSSLKKMCQFGMSSIMVIHQPRYSLFTLFDDVLLLGKGGKTCYLGPSAGAKAYFDSLGYRMPANENPSDWFMDIMSGVVKNPDRPDMNVNVLFETWKTRPLPSGWKASVGREMDQEDDTNVLKTRLEEEWWKIDHNKNGILDRGELRDLLSGCTNSQPTDEVVDDLFEAMADSEDGVTLEKFTAYLSGLRGEIARGTTSPNMGSLNLDVSSSSEDDSSGDEMLNYKAVALKRRTPGLCSQFFTLVHRMCIQWWRKNKQRALFILALVLGAVVLGCLDKFVVHNPPWDAMTYLNTHTALALLVSIYCLGVFGSDRPVFWRECSTGLSITGHFFSRVFMNVSDLLLMTGTFTTIYYLIMLPDVHFGHYYFPHLLCAFVASGWGYFVSTIVPPQHGPFLVALIVFVVCGLLGNAQSLAAYLTGGIMEWGVDFVSITRWSVMMSFNYYDRNKQPRPELGREQSIFCIEKGAFDRFDSAGGLGYWWTGVIALLAQGLVLHILAYIALRFVNRSKMV